MHKRLLLTTAALTLAALVAPESSHAGGGPRNHLGLFLRLGVGGTYASTGDDLEFSGIGGNFTFLIGGCVSENLALHGSYFNWSLWDPDVEFGNTDGELDGSLSMGAYGGGVTYYFMPANLYLTGNMGLARLEIDEEEDFFDSGDDDETSDWGFAMEGSVGKEWWVGPSWGLGLAGVIGFHSIDDSTGWSVGVRFSATFN